MKKTKSITRTPYHCAYLHWGLTVALRWPTAVVAVLVCILPRLGTAAQLEPKTTFGSGGFVTYQIDTTNRTQSVLTDSSGNVYILATAYTGAGSASCSQAVGYLARYDVNGSLSASWATNPVSFYETGTQLSGDQLKATDMTFDNAGNIIVYNHGLKSGGTPRRRLERVRISDGTRNNTGFYSSPFQRVAGMPELEPGAITVDASGNLILCGGNSGVLWVSRRLSNGDLDTTFGTSGYRTVSASGILCHEVKVDNAGQIVVVGTQGGSSEYFVRRFTSSGDLDVNFGVALLGECDTAFSFLFKSGLAIQGSSYIAVAGTKVFRLSNNGQIDNAFGGVGFFSLTVPGATSVRGYGATVGGEGIIVAGSAMLPNSDAGFVMSLSEEGELLGRRDNFGSAIVDVVFRSTDNSILASGLQARTDSNNGCSGGGLITKQDILTGALDEPQLYVSYGGKTGWTNLTPLGRIKNLLFGNFDLSNGQDLFTNLNTYWLSSSSGMSGWNVLSRGSNVTTEQVRVGRFNADGVDDLISSWGGSWRVSYSATSPWAILRPSSVPVPSMRIGDFDGDGRSDVFYIDGNNWMISYQGTGAPVNVKTDSTPLSNLRFGDFNGDGATDVFKISSDTWFVSHGAAADWTPIGSSSVALASLGFGDFDGNGVTDIFSQWGGHWRVSYCGATPPCSAWTILNKSAYTVAYLAFSDIDGDGVTDLIRSQ